MKYTRTGGGCNDSVVYIYNAQGNLSQLRLNIGGVERTVSYTYNDDNLPVSSDDGTSKLSVSYDTASRVYQKTTKHNGTDVKKDNYTFYEPTNTTTSTQVATHVIDAAHYDKTYSYTYDGNGNILSVSDGTYTTSYVYDSQNQLIRENNQAGGFTHTWTYDNAGNILSRKEYVYTTGTLGTPTDTVTYTYGDSEWGDLLKAYDGKAIESDAIGNPLTDGTWTYTWKQGRELASMTGNGTTWNYTYDDDGLRTKRTNGTATYDYVYMGSQLRQMTVGTDTLYFGYGADGAPMTVTWNGTTYYYVTNIQGDVMAILDSEGNAVTVYSYDAWGNLLSVTGDEANTLGTYNPLRYRGYVYDTETGLYYLQSRYYDPEMGRFINADGLASTGQGMLGNNMFAYCNNSPVLLEDSAGTRPILSSSLQNETKKQKEISFEYMKKLSFERREKIALAAIVYAEAGGENNKTKQAVAHSIKNRIDNGHWTKPDTILEAISYPYQYSAYNNTRYKNAIQYYNTGTTSVNALEVQAMKDSMTLIIPIYDNVEEDFTGGVQYFHSITPPELWYFHSKLECIEIPGTEGFWWYK